MVVAIIFVVASMALLSWAWVNGFDYMNEKHPDYKGEDLFGEDITKMAGRDGWDDNTVHTEGEF
jgi:hypothetical protein